MVVRILGLRIQWIIYISMCPWLLTYGSEMFECLQNETMKTLWCGERQHPQNCKTVTCVQRDAERIKRGFVLLWSHHCNGGKYPKYGYNDNYIWTKDCCLIWAKICYQAKSVDWTNDDETSHTQASTMKTTNIEETFTVPEGMFNSTGIVDLVEQTIPTALEIKAEEDIETNSVMIGLYAGLPVGLFLFVAVLAVVCYIFRDKLKIMAGKFRKRHKEGLYQESGTTSKPSNGNDISRTFANQEYAMHADKENRKSENTPMGVYDFCKSWSEPEQNGSFHHNPIETEANSSCSKYRPGYEELGIGESCNTYNTIGEAADRGRFDPTYNHILGSNISATEMQQGNKGGTEYDNAYIRS